MAEYLLGIDNGGTAIKAGIFDAHGREIAVHSRPAEASSPAPGWYERPMEAVWHANGQVITAVLQHSGIDPTKIACVAVTGHGNGLYLADGEGRGVYPGIMSTDSRAREYVERWTADGTAARLLPRTAQSLWAAQPPALLAWLRDHEPGVLSLARWVFMVKDFIRARLTGEAFAEITDMSATSLMSVRDRAYDDEVLDAYGLSGIREKLPPLRESADLCGKVTVEAARETGLCQGTPVAGGMFDVDAAAIATGITDEETLNIVAGTWCNNQYISRRPVVSPSLFMTSVFSIPGYWLVLEGSATSASNLEWFVSELMGEARATERANGRSVYELCNAEVAGTGAAEDVPVFLPFLYGTNAGPDARAAFVGITGRHRRGHLLRAVYEGVVFSHRTHIEKLKQVRSGNGAASATLWPRLARIAGGASSSGEWIRIFADALQIPVETSRVSELGCLGAATCAGVACGAFPSFAAGVREMVHVARRTEPDPSRRNLYDARYALYRSIIRALAPVWPEYR
ncbi:MAG TPA: FGGY-family carbohydrate kinase [Anaeromyxobacter sp.]|nr:FGGY-family carbohydrate kinase [Anaeromyxobacter sp.]